MTIAPGAAGVFGSCNGPAGHGVHGNGPDAGVSGFSENGTGVLAHSNHGDAMQSFAHDSAHNGLIAMNDATSAPPTSGSPVGNGVLGVTLAPGAAGVFGSSNAPSGRGVQGNGPDAGVSGFSETGTGVLAHSNHGDAMQGFAHDSAHNGIYGHNNATAKASADGPPVGNGVMGFTDVPNASGVCGAIAASNTEGAGVTGIGQTAGRFFGDVVVTRDLKVDGDVVLANADIAEDFDIADAALEAGMVLCIGDDEQLHPCAREYDACVVGVVSGAGDFRPGIILDRNRTKTKATRVPVALTGRVYCMADATIAPIRPGDQLTTSATTGHAMRAEPARAPGAVIGKALRSLRNGRGLIPVLVTLQ